jgi:hypothetical protein
LLDAVSGIILFIVLGSVVLLPLLVVCIAGGTIWAALLRALVDASGGTALELPARPFEARGFLILFGLAAVAWVLIAVSLLGLLSSDGGFVD